MASESVYSQLTDNSSINVAIMIGLAEKSFIDSTVISSLILSNQLTPESVINEFKNRLVIYTDMYRKAVQKDIDMQSWNNINTETFCAKITGLQYVWGDISSYIPQPEQENISKMFQQLLFPTNYSSYTNDQDNQDDSQFS